MPRRLLDQFCEQNRDCVLNVGLKKRNATACRPKSAQWIRGYFPASQAVAYSANDHRSLQTRAVAGKEARHGPEAHTTLDLTPAEVFEISQGATSLPGRWSAVSQCTNDGTTYAGLIDSAGNGQVAVFIARDIEGLYVARASGQGVARGCASVTDALAAAGWLLRQGTIGSG
jgi:hypothetical protein